MAPGLPFSVSLLLCSFVAMRCWKNTSISVVALFWSREELGCSSEPRSTAIPLDHVAERKGGLALELHSRGFDGKWHPAELRLGSWQKLVGQSSKILGS